MNYQIARDMARVVHALVDNAPLCNIDRLEISLIKNAVYAVSCPYCLNALKRRRRQLEASFPKCDTCGSTIGMSRSEAGCTDCRRCAERKAEAAEAQEEKNKVEDLREVIRQQNEQIEKLEYRVKELLQFVNDAASDEIKRLQAEYAQQAIRTAGKLATAKLVSGIKSLRGDAK